MSAEADRRTELAGGLWRVDLRAAERRDVLGDLRQLGVERVAGAVGVAGVAMAGDCAQHDGHLGGEARVAARQPGQRRERIDVREVELPGEQLLERGLGGDRDAGARVVAEDGDAERACVESHRVRTDHCLVDAAVAALEHLPVLVDQEVVTDVVPAVPLDVVQLDAAHDRGGLRLGVVVRPGGVMNDREVDRAHVLRRHTPDRLVGAPGEPRDDRRRVRDREATSERALGRAPHVVRTHLRHVTDGAKADCIGGVRPDEIAEMPAAQAILRTAGVWTGVAVGRLPGAPAGAKRARAEIDRPRAAPVHAHEVEARRRGGEHAAAAVERHVADGHRRAAREGGGRRGERRGQRGEESLHGVRTPTSGSQEVPSAARVTPPAQIESLRL